MAEAASFTTKLRDSITRNDSLLCVGLDPHTGRIPSGYKDVLAFNTAIIEATSDLVCAYKPNYAFYEAMGQEGLRTLATTIERIPAGIPIILDAKRTDIGSTASAYARATYEVWKVDAVTVNPYLGWDGIQPFLEYANRGVFVLCHTSNPSAPEIQSWRHGGIPLYEHVLDLVMAHDTDERLGFVIGATYPTVLMELRQRAPRAWFLVPGVGAQGGDLEAAVKAGLRADGRGLMVNSSRGVLYSPNPRAAALDLRERINGVRECASMGRRQLQSPLIDLIKALFDIGCVRFGDFVLHSGQSSPVYVDLRRLASYPRVLDDVARAYMQLMAGLRYDRIAAIPLGALPIGTAVSLSTEIPLIYPRKETKDHGTKRAIEGEFVHGERVVVLDDLITTGASKLEAIAPLEEHGLVVKDVIVLIDRGQGGREYLADRGYRLHSVIDFPQMLDVLCEHRRISASQRDEVKAFLAGRRSD